MTYVAILLSVFFTSLVSGLVGMAGGALLMAILVNILPVPSAMILHAITQLSSNSFRALILREHLRPSFLFHYIIGAIVAFGLLLMLAWVPDAAIVLLLVGFSPWAVFFARRRIRLNVLHRPTAIWCGAVVTSANLFAGAGGPVLDSFFSNSGLDRQVIVANKAITQTFSHSLRIAYYLVVAMSFESLSTATIVCAVFFAYLGTTVGTKLLNHWDNKSFNRVSTVLILTIGFFCILQGIYLYLD